jgi:hypothetical protein
MSDTSNVVDLHDNTATARLIADLETLIEGAGADPLAAISALTEVLCRNLERVESYDARRLTAAHVGWEVHEAAILGGDQ